MLRRVSLATFLLTVLAASPAAARQLTPLQDATCEMPPDLRSVTGHALFRYLIGPAGRVESIEDLYATSEPLSRRKAFIAALRSCLQGWRYEASGAQRVPLTARMLMAFHYFRPVAEGAPSITLSDGRALPLVHIQEMREERVRLATRILAGREYSEVKQATYTIQTDVAAGPRKSLMEAIDRAHRAFTHVFPTAPALTADSMLNVFLFRDEEAFNQVAAFDNLVRMKGGIAGQYSPVNQTAYASLGNKPPALVINEMVHEVTHHLVHQRLFRDGRDPPRWVNEGIATFMELLRPGKGPELARFERGTQTQGGFRWQALGDTYLEALAREAKAESEPDLKAFLAGSPELGPMKSDLFYGLSWLIVHFLITGEDEAYRRRFETWLLTQADARNGESVASALDLTIEELGKKLAAHRKRLEHAAY
jgi:hypothetical protein